MHEPAKRPRDFGVTVETAGASPQICWTRTQAVGWRVHHASINLGVSGGYTTTLADLGFASGNWLPPMFQNLAGVVSQGSQVLGKIYGADHLVSRDPGPVRADVRGRPTRFGFTVCIPSNVSSTPPTLPSTSSAATVAAGQAATLTWSSQMHHLRPSGGTAGRR